MSIYSRRNDLRIHAIALLCLGGGVALSLTGCTSSNLDAYRQEYYAANFINPQIAEINVNSRDYVLALMERGMLYQASGQHTLAIRDWLDAASRISDLDYIRLSEKASSLIINDYTQAYTGKPYERALLHAFTAQSFFALQEWREAAVEARLIADGLESLNGFPDDPYTRYVAALAFEFILDYQGARIEYTRANELLPTLHIDPASGAIASHTSTASPPLPDDQLIGLIGIGRAPRPQTPQSYANQKWGHHPYVDVIIDGQTIGRSYTLNTTANLLAATQERLAAIQLAKTASRIIIKDSIADAVADENPLMGEILRLLLYAMEVPDTRSWQTLPNWLQVIRIPFPQADAPIELHFKSAGGRTLKITRLTRSLPNSHGRRIFSMHAF